MEVVAQFELHGFDDGLKPEQTLGSMQVEPTSGEEYSDFMFWRRPITTGPIFEAAADASRLRAPWRSIQPGRGRASRVSTRARLACRVPTRTRGSECRCERGL